MLVFSGSFMGTVHSLASFASLKLSLLREKCFFLAFTYFDNTLLFILEESPDAQLIWSCSYKGVALTGGYGHGVKIW